MPKRWRIAIHDPERAAALQRALGVPSVVAQLLLCRGIEQPDDARRFLDAKLTGLRDPEELPGASQAAELIHQAVLDRRKIIIYGDYDADGMTATAILLLCLRQLGANVDFYVPHRIDEGYGLNCEALRTLAGQGAELIVTVDCGIASVTQSHTAAELGVPLIITDHHQMADRLPQAAAIVHPQLPGHNYPFAGLCGAAVAFKLAWAICQRASDAKRVSEPMRNFLMQAVGLAAIGTVADVVPLVDENRIIVRHGLHCLRDYPTAGVAALERVAKLGKDSQIDSEDVAFGLAPRLNAVGRLGQAELAIELLTTQDQARATQLAQYIDTFNIQRQSLERSVLRSAHKQAREQFAPEDNPALVLAGEGWHPGVIGIVAGRLAEKYHLPVLLIALDELGARAGIGSGRSAGGLNLHEALAACGQHLVSHGGHAAAAGLKIEPEAIDAFRIDFCAYVERHAAANGQPADLLVDVEAPLAMLSRETVAQIESLAPFGHGNSRPMLCATGVRICEPPRRMGATGSHLSLGLEQHGVRMRAVAFGNGDWEEDLARVSGPLSVAFHPRINRWRGQAKVEMRLADWREEG